MPVANNTGLSKLTTTSPITSTQGADPKIVEERKANLPLPEQPPTASDWQSADARNVNVGSGATESDISYGTGASSLREPATGDNNVGRTAKDGLSGLPNDAVAKEKKHHTGLEDTTGKDYGYPQKSDPSSGVK